MSINTSIRLRPDMLQAIEARGENRSEVIHRDLARLYELYRHELAELAFTAGEAGLIVDVLNGTLITDASQARHLWAEVEDGIRLDHLDEKWSVDGPALIEKLRALRLGQCLAVIDAAERFWAAVAAHQDPKVEDYLPVRS
ncbi:MAG TPA: hypothetical protein GXX28_09160 [Firmicutes bacterium]|nr:hypothetical protein [Bacillota bacterium]